MAAADPITQATPKRAPPTAEQVRAVLDYNPETGEMHWKHSRLGVTAGKRAGAVKKDGRRDIMVLRYRTKTARVAWLLMTGEWPEGQVDHISGDPSDDRFVNLRDVPPAWNAQNRVKAQRSNKNGSMGAGCHKDKFQARLRVQGRNLHLGTFSTPEEASAAYLEAKRRLHPGCTI
jgi:hypothetical protein